MRTCHQSTRPIDQGPIRLDTDLRQQRLTIGCRADVPQLGLLCQHHSQWPSHPDLITGNQNPHIDATARYCGQAANLSYRNDTSTAYDECFPCASDAGRIRALAMWPISNPTGTCAGEPASAVIKDEVRGEGRLPKKSGVGAIVNGLNQPLPLVRFQRLVQKAAEIPHLHERF